jgi:hypothetical protein
MEKFGDAARGSLAPMVQAVTMTVFAGGWIEKPSNRCKTTSDLHTGPSTASRQQVVYRIAALYAIASFLWKVLTPAHEFDSQAVVTLGIVFDIGILVGLIATRISAEEPSVPGPLIWAGIVATCGSLLLRLNGDAGWWTGHLTYSLQ